MLKQAKRAVLGAAKSAGIFRVLRSSAWRNNRLLVLCYHAISIEDEHQWHRPLFMTPDVFEQRMKILARSGATVLPFGHAVELLYKGELPPCSVTITFDGDIVRRGIDVQLHTHRHRTPLDAELFQREIHQNRAAIQQMTGVTAKHFCYPSGVTHPEIFALAAGMRGGNGYDMPRGFSFPRRRAPVDSPCSGCDEPFAVGNRKLDLGCGVAAP